MSDRPLSPPPDQPAPAPARRQRRRRTLMLLGVFNAVWSLVVLCAVSGVLALYLLYDRPFVAPAWAQARIEARLAEEIPNARVSFGEMRLLIEEGWRPRVRLRDVSVSTLDGAEFLRLSEAKAQLSMRALTQGRVQPRQIALRGVFATLIREPSGEFALQAALGVDAPARRMGNLGEVVAGLDTVLSQPVLASMQQAEVRGLTLQYIDRRAGQAYTLDGGRLIAHRRGDALRLDADLALLGSSGGVTTLTAEYASTIGETQAQFGLQLDNARTEDLAPQSPAFAWMGALKAPISGSLRSGVLDDGTLAPLNAALQIGPGAVQPNAGTRPIAFDALRSYFTYDAAEGTLQFDELSVRSPWLTATAEGIASLSGLREGALQNLTGQFEITKISANPLSLYPAPLTLDRARLDFSLLPDPFTLKLGALQIRDGTTAARASGTLHADPEGWRLALDARADQITPARVLAFWPQSVKVKTRKWLADNLIDGQLRNADFALRLAPGAAPRSLLAFDFEDATVRVLRGLPPISDARGHASLEAARFALTLDAGEMQAGEGGRLSITDSSFVIPDTRIKPRAPADVRLNTRSSLTAALWTLDQPPMRVLQRAGLPVALGQGEASLSGSLSFPLGKGGSPADVDFDFTGTLRDVQSDTLIKGRRLAATELSVRAVTTGVEIGGQGTLDGLGFDGTWAQPIGAGAPGSTWTGSATLTPDALARFNVALPAGTLTGAAAADLTVNLPRGAAPRLTLRSGLRGMAVNLPQLGWRKPAGAAGQLAVDVVLGARPAVPRLALSAPGLDAAGSLTLAQGGGLERLRLERLRVGGWLDVPADLIGQGPGRAPQVVVRGGTLDLRRADFGGGGSGVGGGAATPPMQVALNRLQITDTLWLSNLRGTFATTGGLEGPFQGQLNGGTAMSGRVSPRDGRTAVRVQAQDAGGLLRSAGVIRQAVGGALDLTLVPVGRGGAFDGRLTVTGVSIRDAPAMAALVNAVSVVGLINEMNGDGIYFDEVAARFRLTPNRMTLAEASAVGASLGLSMDGVFATDTGQIAMQGVITPVYLLNGIGSVLTRKGEGLIGFNYALRGNAKDPKVSINPLSALAPGGLRDVFRAPKTQLPQVEGAAPTPEPAAEDAPAQRPVEQRAGDR